MIVGRRARKGSDSVAVGVGLSPSSRAETTFKHDVSLWLSTAPSLYVPEQWCSPQGTLNQGPVCPCLMLLPVAAAPAALHMGTKEAAQFN